MSILYFIIALGVLIFIHELGHFIMAKRAGVRVETFSLGFGPRLIGFRKGETLYKISALPLGGYVKLTGEDPASEEASHPKSFAGKSISARLGVVAAGPIMNLVLAALIMPLVFMLGRPVPAYLDKSPVVTGLLPDSPAAEAGLLPGDKIISVGGESAETWGDLIRIVLLRPNSEAVLKWERDGAVLEETVMIQTTGKGQQAYLGIEPSRLALESTRIDDVASKGAAAQAGLQAGDQITSINGEAVATWSQMSAKVQASEGKPLTVEVERNGNKVTATLTPAWDEGLDRYLLGVQKSGAIPDGEVIIKKFPFWQAIVEGTKENVRLAGLTFQVVGRLVTFQLSYKSLGGPLRIAQASAAAARSGVADFLFFMAFLSMQLGVLNLLPIPVLDGGHLLFLGIEAIRRKPVSQRVQGIAIQLGLFLLLSVMLIVTVNDIDVIWDWSALLDKLKSVFS